MTRRWLAVSALVTLTATSGYAQQAAASSVLPRAWAGGRPGRHAVGVSTIALDAGQGQASLGRVIVWRPVEWPAPPVGLEGLSRSLCGPDATVATCFPELVAGASGADSDTDSMPTAAAGGMPIAGRQPLVLAVGSLASRGGEFVALAELLASHGLVVAEVLPPAGVSTTAFDDRAVTTSVERLGRARATLAADDGIDPARLAVLTWSFGGVPGTVAACESLPALAIVSLDSALGYRYGADLLRSRGIDITTCAAGLLSVRAGVGNPVPTDHTFMDRWAPGRVVRIAAAGMAHGDFSDRHGALPARLRPAADAAAFRQRFGAVADQIVGYLVTTLRAH